MIFVSSSCVKNNFIKDSIIELHDQGFKNIELSGGTKFYKGMIDDLLELKEKYSLNYLCHNYFPPPEDNFVLNLASLQPDIYYKSYQHILKTLNLCKRLGVNKYAFHAGFFLDPEVKELGNKFKLSETSDSIQATEIFCTAYENIRSNESQVEIYIENNVISYSNYQIYKLNPFMLTNLKEYKGLHQKIKFNLLLDIAHLKVSCNSLSLDYANELRQLIRITNYIHVSDNDGLHDLNEGIKYNSELYNLLDEEDLKGKTFTLEVYDGQQSLINSYELLNNII